LFIGVLFIGVLLSVSSSFRPRRAFFQLYPFLRFGVFVLKPSSAPSAAAAAARRRLVHLPVCWSLCFSRLPAF
jgi:hypothetical protein